MDIPPSACDLPTPKPDAGGSSSLPVTLSGDEYRRLLSESGAARSLAAYVIGVLSVGKFDKKTAQMLRDKCGEFYPLSN